MPKVNVSGLAKTLFNQRLPNWRTTGSHAFRQGIIAELEKQTGCSNTVACSSYNNAKKSAQAKAVESGNADQIALFDGLGRDPAKNNGGRKRLNEAVAESAVTAEATGE
jgi:hypothetical protein